MKFGVENRNVNFASPLIERNVRSYALSHILFADCINARPYTSTINISYSKEGREAYLQLDCGLAESDALAKQPFSFDCTHCSRLLCPLSPCRERQAKRASHEQRNNSEGEATNQSGRLAECRPQQVSFEAALPAARSALL